ncbi:MAG: AAA family ATPase [Deltaproteobacteria bacterium]|jgi:hypothetical protein|nr:AAA family ATPase [Deltaproteobacteria bacterium]
MTGNPGKLLTNSAVLKHFISEKSPFVDKTGIIGELLCEPNGSFLLCRPRRFGKTLLLDTIDNIFSGRKALFKSLAIGNSDSGYDWKTFPVLRIDLTGTSSAPENLDKILVGKMKIIADAHKVSINQTTSSLAILTLIKEVSERHIAVSKKNKVKIDRDYPANVVLLIDEYDFPLQDKILDFQRSRHVRAVLRDFFAEIKSCEARIRFCLITGITKFDQLSLSSGMNSVEDITYDPRYSAICGFTSDEIDLAFGNYLDFALDRMKTRGYFGEKAKRRDLIAKIGEWYDGYTWDGQTKVLNPYSVTKCLKFHRFSDYWVRSGSSMMIDQLGLKPENYFRIFSDDITVESDISISESKSIYNDNAILLQSGYLTISGIDEDLERYSLKIPNNEIYTSISRSLLAKTTDRSDKDEIQGLGNPKYRSFYDAFCSRNQEDSEMLFSSFISDASYYYNITQEYMFTMLLSLCLDIGKNKPMKEVPVRKGRSDIVMPTSNGEWMVIELKVDRPQESTKQRSAGEPLKTAQSGDHEFAPSTVRGAVAAPGVTTAPSLDSDDSRVLSVGELTESAVKSLKNGVEKAFKQIVARGYAVPYLARGQDVYAVAVAIHDSSHVMIRFKRVVWKDKTKETIKFL